MTDNALKQKLEPRSIFYPQQKTTQQQTPEKIMPIKIINIHLYD